MRIRNVQLAHLMPDRYDRVLSADAWDQVVDIPAGEIGKYRVSKKALPANQPLEMAQSGGIIRFDKDVDITQLLCGRSLWMSITPSEISDMKTLAQTAAGHVIVAGLGLGVLATLILRTDGVKTVTVVELSHEVLDLVVPHISPSIRTVNADYKHYITNYDLSPYDSAFLDIWGDLSTDALPEMIELWNLTRPHLTHNTGGIWWLELLIDDLFEGFCGGNDPQVVVDELRNEEYDEAADHIEDHYLDTEYDEEDDEWIWDPYDAIHDAFETVYHLP